MNFIFLNNQCIEPDKALFFRPITDQDKFIEVEDYTVDFAVMAVQAGFFPSLSQARKNGWQGIPNERFGSRKFGKQHHVWWLFQVDKILD